MPVSTSASASVTKQATSVSFNDNNNYTKNCIKYFGYTSLLSNQSHILLDRSEAKINGPVSDRNFVNYCDHMTEKKVDSQNSKLIRAALFPPQ